MLRPKGPYRTDSKFTQAKDSINRDANPEVAIAEVDMKVVYKYTALSQTRHFIGGPVEINCKADAPKGQGGPVPGMGMAPGTAMAPGMGMAPGVGMPPGGNSSQIP